MNLILTSICNKSCSFCFASKAGKKEEFNFEELKDMINELNENEPIKLLGGEPTLYSYFPELIEYLSDKSNDIV